MLEYSVDMTRVLGRCCALAALALAACHRSATPMDGPVRGNLLAMAGMHGASFGEKPVKSIFPVLADDGNRAAFLGLTPDNRWKVFVAELGAASGTPIPLDEYAVVLSLANYSVADRPLAISGDGALLCLAAATDSDVDENDSWVGLIAAHLVVPDEQLGDWVVAERPAIRLAEGDINWPSLSWGGRHVAFVDTEDRLESGDANDSSDVFYADLDPDETGALGDGALAIRVVSVSSHGHQGPHSSGDIFASEGTSISADGAAVAFASAARLNADDRDDMPDIYVHNVATGMTELISLSFDGSGSADAGCGRCVISGNGRFVAFESYAANLVPGSTGGKQQIFLYDRQLGSMEMLSADAMGGPGNSQSSEPTVSGDGRFVAFRSTASNILKDQADRHPMIIVCDRDANADGEFALGERRYMNISCRAGCGNDCEVAFPSLAANARRCVFQSKLSRNANARQWHVVHVAF